MLFNIPDIFKDLERERETENKPPTSRSAASPGSKLKIVLRVSWPAHPKDGDAETIQTNDDSGKQKRKALARSG